MVAPRKQVNDILVSLYRARGLTEKQANDRAATKLDEAVARVTPLVKDLQDIRGWQASCLNLHAWIEAHP